MARRLNHAPRLLTIIVAVVLIVAGWFGTFGGALPETVGIGALVTATVVMLIGIVTPGL